jgi:hypothetical protein
MIKTHRASFASPTNSPSTYGQVQVWEYLGNGLWSSLGEAFPTKGTDPFWLLLIRWLPWWPHGHEQIHTEE